MRWIVQKVREFFMPPPRTWGRRWLVAVFIAMFLVGYNLTEATRQQCGAWGIVDDRCTGGCVCSGTCPLPCVTSGTTAGLVPGMISALRANLEASSVQLEQWLKDATGPVGIIDSMVKALLERLNQLELDMIDWWETMWYYGLKPSMQAMTRQLNTTLTQQVEMLQAVTDAGGEDNINRELKKQAVKDHRAFRPSENICAQLPSVGGRGRTTFISRAMRGAWQNKSLAGGLNKKGATGSNAAVAVEAERYKEYKEIFCDPASNGGRNDCTGGDPKYFNLDAQPTKVINNQLTIDVKSDPKMEETVETIQDNMVGVTAADPITLGALDSAPGQQTFLDRRAYLARYAAIRSVPHLVTGWRVPGGGPDIAVWIKELREAAGIPPTTTFSDNPSYKELVHAASVDRFNSGQYAASMITDEAKIEMEKLSIDAFYLMQLRDYYELLERTALTLAVQVSMMVEQQPLPNAVSVAPLKP